ncbi:ABC transporter ATP-binding protein [Anaerorhabdus sp.]|uniref:ABC transporter ATP-binding protein n=1 Tax=Anaerorhabdus sp. TaxID=1872524 RepID=UPI002FC83DD8
MNTWDFVKKYCKDNQFKLYFMIVVTLLYAFLNLVSPLIFSFFIDNIIDNKPITNELFGSILQFLGGRDYVRQNLWIGAACVLLVNVFVCLGVFIRGRLNGVISENMSYHIRNDLYDHLQHLPYAYHVSAKTGDLVQRCTSDVEQVRKVFAGQLSEMIYSVATAVIAIIVLFSIYPPMAILAIVSMPLLIFYAYVFFKNTQKTFLESDEAEGVMTTTIQESLSGIRVIKAFNRERYEIDRFQKKNEVFKDLTFKLIRLLGIYWSTSDLICLSQILLILVVGIFTAIAGNISVGNFFVFISYETMILWPIRNLGRILADIGKATVSVGRLNEILNEPIEDITTGLTPTIEGKIEFEHCDFQYHDANEPILRDISFTIDKGETVAIIGPTGAGKSTLVHLLSRLYDYTGGSIKMDGVELNKIQREHIRRHIGIVLQEPFLFSKTIHDNIRLANRFSDEGKVERAARVASVHEVIQEFEQGYETLVGEKGVTLSGGQKQRIAIARTIINETPILIFDDSLSAVDTETDANIRHALNELNKETTKIIITQRVSSAQDADKILVIEDGRITQIGNHESLIHEDGLYKRIYEIQSSFIRGGDDNE